MEKKGAGNENDSTFLLHENHAGQQERPQVLGLDHKQKLHPSSFSQGMSDLWQVI